MSLNVNLFTLPRSIPVVAAQAPETRGMVACPNCGLEVAPAGTEKGWQSCTGCDNRLQIRTWPVARQRANPTAALPDQATCFFHPDKGFQACCQRCGRFVCALCDLQLGAEHVCPTCFERGRADTGLNSGKAEWRHRDVLYDSIALVLGWGWIIVWPVILAAIPVGDCSACEVPEGAAFVFDSALGLALLGGLCGIRLAPAADCHPLLRTVDRGETLIAQSHSAKFRASAA